MTICIAAMSYMEGIIVTISDRSLSYGDAVQASDNAALKAFSIASKWGAMFAGSGLGAIPEIIQDVRSQLYMKRDHVTVELVQTAFRTAWLKSASQRIVDRYLLPFGYTSLEEFRQKGLEELGAAEFARIVEKVEAFDPGLSFLVYGFDEDPVERAHIFEISKHDGHDLITSHDIQGFGVIGSGSWAALPRRLTPSSAGVNHKAMRSCRASAPSGVKRRGAESRRPRNDLDLEAFSIMVQA